MLKLQAPVLTWQSVRGRNEGQTCSRGLLLHFPLGPVDGPLGAFLDDEVAVCVQMGRWQDLVGLRTASSACLGPGELPSVLQGHRP